MRRAAELFLAGQRKRATTREEVAGAWKTSVIAMPKHLIVERDEQRAHLRAVLYSAMTALRDDKRRVRFDFSRVEKIFPGGMLVFLAHLYLMKYAHPNRVSFRALKGSLPSQLLAYVGESASSAEVPRHESVVNWRYLTGTGSDGAKINDLLNSYAQHEDIEIPEGLYDVLAEAFTNVRQHAFPTDFETDVPQDLKRWWLFSRLDRPTAAKSGNLYIAIYDIGMGIQQSLRRKMSTGEWVLEQTEGVVPAAGRQLKKLLLQRAVEHERSSTGLKNRGLGLPEMRDFALNTVGGRLYILSGGAQYACSARDGAGTVYQSDNPFTGTLILWSLPLALKDSA